MFFPVIDFKIWAKQYKLKSPNLPCIKCGKALECIIPFAHENIRGLMSASHGCPEEYDHSVSRSVSAEDVAAIDGLYFHYSLTAR